nr:cysteine proteinase inhibitor 1-like [Quercus suber]POE54014.1 cysteine proteinase inhibitor 5 [Quercus suber]
MKAQKYFFYLYLLTLLILPIYVPAIRGKPGVRDKGDWKPIKNIKDPYVKGIADFALFEFNKRSNFNLLFEGVLRGQTRYSNGTYYRLAVAAKNGAHTRNYRAVVFEQPWVDLRKLIHLTAFTKHRP